MIIGVWGSALSVNSVKQDFSGICNNDKFWKEFKKDLDRRSENFSDRRETLEAIFRSVLKLFTMKFTK